MDDFYFTWCNYGMNSICVDVYQVLRPSLVCNGKFLTKYHTRFEKRTIDEDDEISIIKCGEEYLTGELASNGLFRIPNTQSGNHRWDNLFSLYDIAPVYDGHACNPDLSVTLYKPIIKFIEYYNQAN